MADALSIALSGLNAQKQRLATTASNIANVSTSGSVPGRADSPAPVSTVYQPLQTSFVALDGGGVMASAVPKANGYSLVYDPSNAYANDSGVYAVPNVDFAEEFVNLSLTKQGFKANLAVIKVYDDMMGEMLDTLA